VKRSLAKEVPSMIRDLNVPSHIVMPGVIAINASEIHTLQLKEALKGKGDELLNQQGVVAIILTEDAAWMGEALNNFLWATFTRTNPSHDIEGVDSGIQNKHWGCAGPLIINATIKKHHAPPVVMDAAVDQRAAKILSKYGW
jgi:4-hydroxy-3-polyprenylbenzoate decarboxylase